MPALFNDTPLVVDAVPFIGASGRQLLVVVGKVTFDIDVSGRLSLTSPQPPIQFVDRFTDEEPEKTLQIPSDLCDFKPAADILIAPPGTKEALAALQGRKVEVRVGACQFAKKAQAPWPFGPLPRDIDPRKSYAGTYDTSWATNRMPLLPDDFDPRFHQVAPADQITSLQGDEAIVVKNLYAASSLVLQLPGRCMLVAGNVRGRYFTAVARLDTLILESEVPRLTLVWRYAIEVNQKVEEIGSVFVYLARVRTVRELYGSL